MEPDGLPIRDAAAVLGVSDRTIRRYIAEHRRQAGDDREGVISMRGHRLVFRRLPGTRNDAYRIWIDPEGMPDRPSRPSPLLQAILDRLESMEIAVSSIRERLDRLESQTEESG